MARRFAVGLTVAALACSGMALSATPAGAATFDVTSGLDDGTPGTFRWAVEQAGLGVGPDIVEIDPSVPTITLDDCLEGRVAIAPTGLLTINGNGATVTQTCADGVIGGIGDTAINDLTITGGDAAGGGGGIELNGALTLDGVTITGNAASGSGGGVFGVGPVVTNSFISGNTAGGSGGGIFAIGTDPMSVTDTTVDGNTAGTVGGGLVNGGPIEIVGSSIIDNEALTGGGLFADGDITLTGSDLSDNTAGVTGAGVATAGGLSVVDSTVEGNTAGVLGGGLVAANEVFVSDSTVADNQAEAGAGVVSPVVLVVGSSITGNVASEFGGGIFSTESAVVTNSTVTGNSAAEGAGIAAAGELDLIYTTLVGNLGSENLLSGGPVSSIGTVIALGAATDCRFDGGSMVSGGYNFSGDASCGFTASTDMASGGDPLLSTLDLHGGPTANHLPVSGSPLLNRIPAGDPACDGVDQRGFDRPQNGACDIGSVEVRNVTSVSTVVTTPYETPVAVDLVPLITDPDNVLSEYEVEGAVNASSLDAAEGGVVTYTPRAGFSGADSYTYIACSEGLVICTTPQTVSITVAPGPQAAATPVAAAPRFAG